MGAAEIALSLGVSRQRVSQLQHSAGFPAPVARLKMGAVWRAIDIDAWATRAARRRNKISGGTQIYRTGSGPAAPFGEPETPIKA